MLPACKKNKTVVVDKVVFGSFHGMCPAGCVDVYRVDTSTLYEDTTVQLFVLNWSYNFIPGPAFDSLRRANAMTLLMDVPAELTSGTEHVFGVPDSHDQGGVYLQVTKDGVVHKYRIDNDNNPGVSTQVGAYRDRVNSVIEQLKL